MSNFKIIILLCLILLFLSSCQKPIDPASEIITDHLLGFDFNVENVEQIDSWDYYNGIIDEFEVSDERDNKAVVFLDRNTKELKSFYLLSPLKEEFLISEEDALEIALRAASATDYFKDQALRFVFEIHDNPNDYPYGYYFEWTLIDPKTGADLLKHVRVAICPKTGKITSFIARDFGDVKISTQPQIQARDARKIALGTIEENLVEFCEETLLVTIYDEEQKLVWEVSVLIRIDEEMLYPAYVLIDAINGDVLDTTF